MEKENIPDTPSPSRAPFPEPNQDSNDTWVPNIRSPRFPSPVAIAETSITNQPAADWGPLYTSEDTNSQQVAENQNKKSPKPNRLLPTGHVMVTADFVHQYHELLKELTVTKAKMEEFQRKSEKINERNESSQSGATTRSGESSRSGSPLPGPTSRPGTTTPSGTTTEPVEGVRTPTPPPTKIQHRNIQEERSASVTSASTSTTIRNYLGHISGPASIYHRYKVYKRLYRDNDVYRHKYNRLKADLERRQRRNIDSNRRTYSETSERR